MPGGTAPGGILSFPAFRLRGCLDRMKELLDLGGFQFPKCSDRQAFICHVADTDPAQLDDRMADAIEHLSDLLISALAEDHLEPAVAGSASPLKEADPSRSRT